MEMCIIPFLAGLAAGYFLCALTRFNDILTFIEKLRNESKNHD